MKIRKAILIDPDQNFWFGVVAVALSVFVFAYSARFGPVSILSYYALWLPLILVDYRRVLGNYARNYWIVGFGLFACLSVFWSDAPSATARAAVQYLSHIVCALIVARVVGVRTLALGAITGIGLVLLYSLAFGSYSYDPIDGSYSFVGAFTSKNQVGFYASLGLYFAFAWIVVLRERGLSRVLAIVVAAVSAYVLLASQSATSIIATVAILALGVALEVALRFSPEVRKVLLAFGIALGIGSAFVALNMGALDALLGAFGKDATLTGRTYLWSEGLRTAGERPLLGVGYYAYWVQGFSEAERLWDEFFIENRGGFHFHNTYIEVLVELGAIGLILIAIVMMRILAGHLSRLLKDARNPNSIIMFGIAALLLIRSFVEVDFMHPYAIGSFLLYYAAGLLARPRRLAVHDATASVPLDWRLRNAR